jgi:hypothetical protein
VSVVGVYLVATLVMTFPFVNWSAFGSAAYPGDARLMIWTLAWNHHAVLGGLPLLDANVFYPAAAGLTYNDPLVGIALVTLPLHALTHNPILVHNVAFIASFLLNGLTMHGLAYRYSRSHLAALVAGVTFAFSYYMMLHAPGHLSLIWTWPLPLAILLHDRWVERPTAARAVIFGLVLLLQLLASWYLAAIALVGAGLHSLWRHAVDVRDVWGRRLGHVLLVGLMICAVLWPLAAPFQRSIPTPSRSELLNLSATWASYLDPPPTTVIGLLRDETGRAPRPIWGEVTLFLGWIATGLAAIGLLSLAAGGAWRRYGGFALLGAIALLLSFGPARARSDLPSLFDLLHMLPGMAGFRAPARFGVLVLFGVSMLAGAGVAAALARFGRPARAAVLGLVPFMLVEWLVVAFPLGKPQRAEIPAIYRHEALATARSIASLPDYRLADDWWLGADYLLYSTVHWRPIANGYGRAEPPEHQRVNSHVRAFPGPNNARTMRELGIDFIVVHGARMPGGAEDLVKVAADTGEYELVARDGSDYLFRVKPGIARAGTP